MSGSGLWDDAVNRLKSVGAPWATWSLIGTFVFYVLGYLAIRFHLSVLGVGTDLGIIDERFLFAGAKFVVYLVSAGVSLLLFLLLPAAICYAVYRLVARRWKLTGKLNQKGLLVLGIVLAVLFVQLVMRKCFLFGNLLMAQDRPPDARWLSGLLIGADDTLLTLFFVGLVASIVVTGGLLVLAGRAGGDAAARGLFWLLAFLVAVQVLLLPINYGTLIADKVIPKVASLDGVTPLRPGEDAWLVWEGNNGMTFLVRRPAGGGAPRSLVTLDRKEVKRVEIIGYDRILSKIFGGT